MPELAFFGAIGASLSLIVSALIYIFEIKKFNSAQHKVLQSNLKLIAQRWNDLNGDFEDHSHENETAEIDKTKNTVYMVGFASFILSWLGLFFICVIYISYKKLSHTKALYNLFDQHYDDLNIINDKFKQAQQLINR